MHYRTFGRLTGLRVSEYALGAGNFGTGWGTGAEPAEARRIFDRFAEAGGTLIDTAESYQLGESETLLGEFLAADRDHFVVATKYSMGVDARTSQHRQQPQEHDPGGRGQPEAARDRPHRPLLGALPGRPDADRGDPARPRRPGLARQDPATRGCRTSRPGGSSRGADDRRAARLVAGRRHPGRVQPRRAHRRPRAAADGRGAGARRRAVVAARRRAADRQVPPERRRAG